MKRALQSTICTVMFILFALCMGGPAALGKDKDPTNIACDGHDKAASTWKHCIAANLASDDELFYAGYWLAKSGRYVEALKYLRATKAKTARVETYIGFATRKLGDIESALGHYDNALNMNPNDTVARSYLGEAYLALRKVALAEQELRKIGALCGVQCKEYTELNDAITKFVRRKS